MKYRLKKDLLKGTEVDEEFAEQFPSMVEPVEEKWPTHGDNIWYIDEEGDILEGAWIDTSTVKNRMLSIGNVFRTKAEAHTHVAKLKARKILEDFAKERNGDWKERENYYIARYSHVDKRVTGSYYGGADEVEGIRFREASDVNDSWRLHSKEWEILFGIK